MNERKYIIFRCTDCGRFLYTKKSNKTRKCPCGETVSVRKAKKIEETDDRKEATIMVRKLQEKEKGKPFFGRFKDEK